MNNKNKKVAVLAALFLIPLVFYIFLSKGIYHHSNLPILTTEVHDVNRFVSEEETAFKDHFNIVAFFGNDLEKATTSIFNLHEIIYKNYEDKKWFQIVAIFPTSMKAEVALLKKEMEKYSNAKGWRFVFAEPQQIKAIFKSFQTPFTLDSNLFSKFVYIIDKKLRLRGRKDDDDTKGGKLYGYDMQSVAVLKNKMKDDIDIIYYQYKKSAEKARRQAKNKLQ